MNCRTPSPADCIRENYVVVRSLANSLTTIDITRRVGSLVMLLAVLCRGSVTMAQEPPSITGIRVGFAGSYKLGCWTPVEIDIRGGDKPVAGIVSVTVPDGDGVPTSVATLRSRPVAVEPGATTTERLYVRIGQNYATLQVTLLDEQAEVAASRAFYSGPIATQGTPSLAAMPATNRLIVEFGPPVGLGDLIQSDNRDELSLTRLARVDDAADLPHDWYGYEGADMVVLTTSRADLYRPFTRNPALGQALRRWVEMGGKLVIFCGSQADELLVEQGALANLLPGAFTDSVLLEESQQIEAFSGAEQSITPNRRVNFRVPVFEEIRGTVLASARRGEQELPLVIRSNWGFGEVTFVGLDFDQDPLAGWAGRKGFLTKVLNLGNEPTSQQQGADVASITGEDLIAKVRNKLDDSFVGVEVVPFALVAVLVIGYVLLIGPGDYFLVNKVFKRPELTWITFPLAVVAVSAAAWWFANWQKGDELRVNQIEFVDVDTTSGFTRGTVWTHFFTPQVNKFHLSIQPAFFAEGSLQDSEQIVSWLGQPGYGLGGMQTGGGQANLFDRGYSFDSPLDRMLGVPVQLWSTKTITARWSAEVSAPLEAKLNRTADQLLVGQIINNSSHSLEEAVLLYGQWAWNVGAIGANSAFNVADAAQPRTVRTLLTNATAGDTTIDETADDGTVPFRLANEDLTRVAKVMMFYNAINGGRYSGMLSRYQGFLDMSHLLDQPDLAILLTKSRTTESRWMDGDKPLGNQQSASEKDLTWTYYRFVLPVGPLTPDD